MTDGADHKSQFCSHRPNRVRIRSLPGGGGGGTWVLPSLPLPIPPSSITLGLFSVRARGWLPSACPGPQLSHVLSLLSLPQFPHPTPKRPTGIHSPVSPHRGRARSHRSPRATMSAPPPLLLPQIHPAPNPAPSSAAALPGLMRLSQRVGLHREEPGINHGASARHRHNHGHSQPCHQWAKLGGTGTEV